MKDKEFAKSSLLLFILMMICNVVNYLFQIVLGRLLNDPTDYGTMNALLSVLNIVSLPVAVVAMVVTKYVAEYDAKDNYGEIKSFLSYVSKVVMILIACVCIVGIITSGIIGKYIHVDDGMLIFLIVFGAAISYLIQIVIGFFQGTKKFMSYGIYNVIAPIAKMIICIVLLLFGFKLWGVTVSIVASNFIAIIIGGIWLYKLFKNIDAVEIRLTSKMIMSFSYSAIFLNVGITLLNNIDMMLIKHYFIEEAGYYSVASVLGKLILYFSNAIVVALFPFVVSQKGNGKNAIGLLKNALLYGTLIAGGAGIGLAVFAEIIIKLMYGTVYLKAVEYIIPICVLVTALSILTIIANYDVALEKANFVTISMILASVFDVIIILIYHENIIHVVWIMAIILSIVAVINLIRVLWVNREVLYGK